MKNKELRVAIQKYLSENYHDLGAWTDFDSKEMMGSAKQAAMQDIKNSGDKFVDLGDSKFEKDLDVDSMIADLEAAKNGKTGNSLKQIEKQLNQLKRFGSGSLNEEEENTEYVFDTKNLYSFLKDAFFQLKEVDYSEAAKILEAELSKNFDVKPKTSENINEIIYFDQADAYALDVAKLMNKDKTYTYKEFIDLFTQKHPIQHSNNMKAIIDSLNKIGYTVENSLEEDSQVIRNRAGQREKIRKDIPLGKHAPHSDSAVEEGIGVGLGVKNGMNVK